jgi:anaerobic ribonucleoside-triphosphate reductase activating protein
MVFSGFTYDHLMSSHAPMGSEELLAHTDLLVSGPFIAQRPDLTRPWAGSTNQEFHYLTDRYRHLSDTIRSHPDRIEVRVRASGEVSINGWATTDRLETLLLEMDLRRSTARPSSGAEQCRKGPGDSHLDP